MDLESAQRQFLRIQPSLKRMERQLRDALHEIIRLERIIHATVDSRTKTVASFSAKVIEKGKEYQPDPLSRMTDKVGLRIELLHLDDVEKVSDRIRSTDIGHIIREENKRDGLGVEDIGYQGVHFDLLPHGPSDVPKNWRCVEIQVRTMSQGTWAIANHEISYKSPVEVPASLRRRLSRMTVFMETFDEEVKRVRDAVMSDEEYPVATLINELHSQRARIGRPPSQSSVELTRRMVAQLLGEHHNPFDIAHNIDSWMDDNEDHVTEVITQYKDVGRQFFVDRPEGLLAFYLISIDKYELAERWKREGYDEKTITDLYLAWGEVVPNSDTI